MMGDEGKVLYTIGHSNLNIDTFLGYLRRYGITTLVDIRSRARSRTEPQFDRERISESLKSGWDCLPFHRLSAGSFRDHIHIGT